MPIVYQPLSDSGTNWLAQGAGAVFQTVDEGVVTADDATTYMYSTSVSASTLIGFGVVTDPGNTSAWKIRIRYRASPASTGNGKIQLTLSYQVGMVSFVVHQWTIDLDAAVNASWQTIEFTPTTTPFNAGYEIQVNWIRENGNVEPHITALELEVPDAVTTKVTRVSRQVMGDSPAPSVRVTRVGREVMGDVLGTLLYVTRVSREVMGEAVPQLRTTSVSREVSGDAPPPDVRVTRATMEVMGKNVYGTFVNTTALPTPVHNFFMANWADSGELISAWSTDVTVADSLAEERRSLVDRPYRSITVRQTGLSRNESVRLWMNLVRFAHTRQVLPLYPDQSRITSASSGTTINCDTTSRRFFNGCRIAIHSWVLGNRPANVFYGIVQTVLNNQLVLRASTPLPVTYPIGSRVYPVMDTEIGLEHSGVFITDDVYDVRLTLNEVVGKSALFTTAIDFPGDVQLSGGVPILNVSSDWGTSLTTRVVRDGEVEDMGRGLLVTTRGDRPQLIHTIKVNALERAQAWKAIQFFDACKGRKTAFYVIAPESVFEVVSVTQTAMIVKSFGNYEDLRDFIDYFAFVRKTGVYTVVALTGTTNNLDGTWTLNYLDPGVTLSLATLRRATTAHLVRFVSDSNRERWSTDETCEMEFECIELLNEKVVTLGNIDESFDFVSSPSAIPDLFFWGDIEALTWKDDNFGPDAERNTIVTLPGEQVGTWDDARNLDIGPGVPWLNTSLGSLGLKLAFPAPLSNGGHRTGLVPGVSVSMLYENEKNFADNTNGLTYAISLRMNDVNISNDNTGVFRLLYMTGVLEWTFSSIKLFQVIDTANSSFWISPAPDFRTGEQLILMLVWKPGLYTRLYKNGQLVGQAASSPSLLPVDITRDLRALSLEGSSTNGYGEASRGHAPWVNGIYHYKRALTSAELNSLGTYVRNRYGGQFKPIV